MRLRVNDLVFGSTGGLNGSYLLNANTVQADGSVDQLTGSGGSDLFFASLLDSITGNKKQEDIISIS